MAAVTLILLVVGLINRFIQYLGQAVAGEMASDILLLLIFYRLPDFLMVILPLALFLAILLVYGRMYAENEMTVLIASGLSKRRLLFLTMAASGVVVLLVALLSLQLAPWGIRNTEQLKQSQDELTELDLIVAGQFQAFDDGNRVTYAERIAADPEGRLLENVFVVTNQNSDEEQSGIRITIAQSARPEVIEDSDARFMRLENVLQYQGTPGTLEFSIGQFDVQSVLLPEPNGIEEIELEKALSTRDLLGSNSPEIQAELQWRLSAILIIPIITLIAIPLSKVQPRQGRYSKLVPAALLYSVYFILLQVSRDQLADGAITPLIGLWWVHVLFLVIGWALYRERSGVGGRKVGIQ
jgi:lipopolysaccharide export system permease protein